MPPEKNKYVEQLREQFLRDFSNARKRYDAELKQKPFFTATTSTGFEAIICIN